MNWKFWQSKPREAGYPKPTVDNRHWACNICGASGAGYYVEERYEISGRIENRKMGMCPSCVNTPEYRAYLAANRIVAQYPNAPAKMIEAAMERARR